MKGQTIKCRMAKPVRTKYCSVFDFEVVLQKAIAGSLVKDQTKKVVAGPAALSPMKFGKGLIAMLGGGTKWVGSKYLAVSLPEQPEFMIPSWRGWLRFMEWAGENPHRRVWSEAQRYTLIASGQYAWIVVLERTINKAKVIYSGGTKLIEYESAWFDLGTPEELQRMLVSVSQYADGKKWRDKEILGLELSGASYAASEIEENRRQRRQEYRRERRAKLKDGKHVEITRVPDELGEDEFLDPLTPDGWNGDLDKRYLD
jgi:hypothetical protein